jgi:hypothetical protein
MNETALSPQAPPREETAEDLLRSLRQLHEGGKLAVRADADKLNHMDSPVVVEADSNIWAYGYLVVVLGIWWKWGNIPGAVAGVLGVIVYYTLGRAYVHRRLQRRVTEKALNDLDTWRKLWRFGGVSLSGTGRPDLGECKAPDGNWMGFVRTLGGGASGNARS